MRPPITEFEILNARPKNIFVLGLLDWQRRELETIDHAEDYRFHGLLSWEELVGERNSFDWLLERARAALDDFDGEPDAIVCHWDFPSSCLAPILSQQYGLRGPSLESVLKCEHKFWSRIQQQRVIPECVPEFEALDPFDEEAAGKCSLDYPFWLKPVKGYSSLLGFRIENRQQLEEALSEMREHVAELGAPFDECLARVELPPEVRGVGGRHAIAESIMSGTQFAPEGYVLDGEMHLHGFFDMMLDHGGSNVAGLRYPADLPRGLEERATDVCERVLKQVGFDNGCFNVEFLWDEAYDKLWLIEVNTRISQSHSEMFRMVRGMSNHEVAVSVALGHPPHLARDKGNHAVAAKLMLQKDDDSVVTRVPSDKEISDISSEIGDALVEFAVEEGQRLSEVKGQPAYCFTVAEAWIGGDDAQVINQRYRQLVERLPVEFADGKRLRA